MSANENRESHYFYCHLCESRQEYMALNLNCPTCGSGFIERLPTRTYNIRPIATSRLMMPNDQRPNLLLAQDQTGDPGQRNNIEELFPHFLRFRELLLNHGRRLLESDFDNIGRPMFDGESAADGGLSEEEMTRLAIVVLNQNDLEKIPACPICLTEYEIKEKVTKLSCDHFYHSGCINTWLKNCKTCPSCRSVVKIPEVPSTSSDESGSSGYYNPYHDMPEQLFNFLRQRQQFAEANRNLRLAQVTYEPMQPIQQIQELSQSDQPAMQPDQRSNTRSPRASAEPDEPMEIIDITSDDEDDNQINDEEQNQINDEEQNWINDRASTTRSDNASTTRSDNASTTRSDNASTTRSDNASTTRSDNASTIESDNASTTGSDDASTTSSESDNSEPMDDSDCILVSSDDEGSDDDCIMIE